MKKLTSLSKRYDKDFWEENKWVSCFECDIIFTDLKKLFGHQQIHIDEDALRYSNLGVLKK